MTEHLVSLRGQCQPWALQLGVTWSQPQQSRRLTWSSSFDILPVTTEAPVGQVYSV